MLPDLSKTRTATREHVMLTIKKSIHGGDTFLSELSHRIIHEGKEGVDHHQDGSPVATHWGRLSSEIELKSDEMDGLTLKELERRAQSMGADMAKQQTVQMFKFIDQLLSKTDQIVKANGEPFSCEHFLRGIEKVDIDFDAYNRPMLPSIVAGSTQVDKMRSELERAFNEPEFKERFDLLIQKKREAFHDREAARKLVD